MASLEAMLFAAGDPVEPGKLAEVLDVDVENVIKMLGHLEAMYDENNRGLRLIRVDGKYQLCTREEYADEVRGLLEIKKNTPLSQAAFEVLAIVAKKLYKEDNCKSQSEFIEKAIIFYAGYVSSNKNDVYLPNVITSSLKSIVKESDNRLTRVIFKIAVELAITMNLIASSQNVDKITLDRLRGECIKEVKRLNGTFSFDDAYYWQNGNE